MALQEEEEVKTLVWWNINTCPIPPGYDSRQVGPRIVSALKKSKVSGPVTITAIGRLTHNPNDDVLRDLSSTGIALIHATDDMDSGSADDNKQETTRLVLQDKCSETGESPWSCSNCSFAGQSFEDFNTHLKSDDHNNNALDCGYGEV